MKKNLLKTISYAMSLMILTGTAFLGGDRVVRANEPAGENPTFQRAGVTRLEYQIDGGQWQQAELKMKKAAALRKPEVTVSAYSSQDIVISRENLGKPIKFRADFIDTTEENAQPKLTGEECRIFDGVTKEDITVLKYTYEGETEEENEATYNLAAERVKGRSNAVMTVNIHFEDTNGNGETDSDTSSRPVEDGFAEAKPVITYTNLTENDAVGGAVVARISMPDSINTDNVEYCFDETNTSTEAAKIRGMFEIRGNEIRIIEDFDNYEFNDSALSSRTVADRKYNDGKKHVKEERSFWLGIYAKKNNVHSGIAYTYEGNRSNLVIGKHVEETIESDKQFHITNLEYYLGEKAIGEVQGSDWKAVDKKELTKINATSGSLGEIAEGYVSIPTDRTFKQLRTDNLYIKVTTDQEGPVLYNNKHTEPLVGDVTQRGSKQTDGYVYGVISVKNGEGREEIWRSFRIKVHPVAKFTSFVFENVEVSADEGVLPDGTRLVVKPIVGEELNVLKEKVGQEKLKSYISAEDIRLVSYSGEDVTIPDGKKVTVKIKKPERVKNESIEVYHVHNDQVEKMNTSLDEENHIVFQTGSLSPFMILADSTVGEDEDKPDGTDTVNPGGDGTDKPDGTDTVNPGGDGTDKPDGTDTVKPDGDGTDKPDGTDTVKPDGDGTDKPDGTDTVKPDGSNPAKPDGNNTVKPDGNNTTKPSGDVANATLPTAPGNGGKAAPQGAAPKTGDASNGIYVSLMAGALLYIGAAARRKKA